MYRMIGIRSIPKRIRIVSSIRSFSSSSPISNDIITLANATKTTRMDDSDNSRFTAQITDKWSIGDAPNGGYLMMMAIDVAQQLLPNHTDPLSFSALFVNKALENKPAELRTRMIAQSRITTTLQVDLYQEDMIRAEFTGIMTNLSTFQGFSHTVKVAPTYPPVEKCIPISKMLRKLNNSTNPIFGRTEINIIPNSATTHGMMQQKYLEDASVYAYVKFPHPKEDPLTLASMGFFLDALMPPVLNATPSTWVPTLQYTVHFWNRLPHKAAEKEEKENEWIRLSFKTDYVQNSLLFTDGEVWSQDGSTLLATSRQSARVLSPKPKK